MSAGPVMRAIGDICTLFNGRAFKPSDWSKRGRPIVRIQNLNDPTRPFNHFEGEVSSRHLIQSGDVLLSWSGTPGTSFGCFEWDRGEAVLNQHIFKVIVNNDVVLPGYFIAAMNASLGEMIEKAHGGVGLRHITKGTLESIQIDVPNIDRQRRIVARIRDAMERVEEMERLSRDVQVSARNLVKAELQTMIHDQRRAGHETVPLGDVTRTSGYGTSQRAHEEPRGVPVLRMGNIVDGQIDETDLKFVELPSPELARQRLVAGDVLVNRTNSLELVGKAAAFDPSTGERVAASYLVRVNVDPAMVLPEWVAYCINGPDGRAFVRRTARRAIGMVNINSKEIARMPILLPPLDVQRDCVRRLDTIRSSASKIVVEHEENVARKLRASILRQAFSGNL